jgi:hypothetical protein
MALPVLLSDETRVPNVHHHDPGSLGTFGGVLHPRKRRWTISDASL